MTKVFEDGFVYKGKVVDQDGFPGKDNQSYYVKLFIRLSHQAVSKHDLEKGFDKLEDDPNGNKIEVMYGFTQDLEKTRRSFTDLRNLTGIDFRPADVFRLSGSAEDPIDLHGKEVLVRCSVARKANEDGSPKYFWNPHVARNLAEERNRLKGVLDQTREALEQAWAESKGLNSQTAANAPF